MAVYEALLEDRKEPPCPSSNPCCKESCDEPSFWDLLPQCRLNWIAFGLSAFAIGFGLIGLGYINIGTTINVANITIPDLPIPLFDPTLLSHGTRLIAIFLGIILISAWILFKACSDDWKTVIVGSLLGASGFPLAAIGLLYSTVAQFTNPAFNDPASDHTWFNIAISLIIASIVGFLLLAYLIQANRCLGCIPAKKGIIVSLIFLSAGWAAWSLGRLLYVAVVTFQYYLMNIGTYVFPSAAFMAFIAVSIINIVLAVALGWYILTCSTDNCSTIFLPLFASAASLGNWALYQVGLNVLSYAEGAAAPLFPPATITLLPRFAYAIGFISISALLLTFLIVNGSGDTVVVFVASAIPLLYAIATYTYVATAFNLINPPTNDFVNSMLQGIFIGIALTYALSLILKCKAKCPIPKIIYGLAAGVFGWAVIYLYSTYSADILSSGAQITTTTTLNIGLAVIISVAIIAVLYVQFISCDELVSAITLLNIALLTVGAGGFIGTIAYYQKGTVGDPTTALNLAGINAATSIYIIYVLLALFLPRFFTKCADDKRRVIIAIASLGFGVAAIDLGRAIVFARALAFSSKNITRLDFFPQTYITSAIGAVLAGQVIAWAYPQANVYTALIAVSVGLVADGIALQIILLVSPFNFPAFFITNTALVGVPWLVFTLAIVALLLFLEFKSLCILPRCRFLVGLLIPVLGIAVFGKIAGASAAYGAAYNNNVIDVSITFLPAFSYTSRLIPVNSIIPLVGFFIALQAFKCTSCLAYLPSSIAYIAVVYIAGEFEVFDVFARLATRFVVRISSPLPKFIASVYYAFDLRSVPTPADIANNARFITQVNLVYILFLSPALIAGLAHTCSKPVSAAILGSAIAATAISFGAFGITNTIIGVFMGAAGSIFDATIKDISKIINFSQFLQGIASQLVLFAVGVLTALFIYFDKCCYRSC